MKAVTFKHHSIFLLNSPPSHRLWSSLRRAFGIPILHEAKEDQFNQQESINEKCRPILSIEAIIVSVMSMLSEPNFESPANIDASVMWKKEPEVYKKKIRKLVRKSQEIMMGG